MKAFVASSFVAGLQGSGGLVDRVGEEAIRKGGGASATCDG